MATEMLQSYELMIIFTPVLAEDDYKTAQENLAKFVQENGGEVVHRDALGLRSLAYPIDKKTTGLYWLMEYKAPTSANAKLEVIMNRDEHNMRYMITRLDKYAVTYNAKRRSKLSNTAEAAV